MSVDAAQFRSDLPEFTDPTRYTDASIGRYLALASTMLSPALWSQTEPAAGSPSQLDYGTELFVAHNLVVDARNAAVAANGGIPGTVKGPLQSGSAGGASVSYDVRAVVDPEDGFWNQSTYGVRFVQLARLVGAGPRQATGPVLERLPLASQAWAGPLPYLYGRSN